MAEQLVIGTFEKGNEEVRVTVSPFKGVLYLDVRAYYQDEEGKMIPTKKGIALPNLETVDKLIALLTKARAVYAKKAKGGK